MKETIDTIITRLNYFETTSKNPLASVHPLAYGRTQKEPIIYKPLNLSELSATDQAFYQVEIKRRNRLILGLDNEEKNKKEDNEVVRIKEEDGPCPICFGKFDYKYKKMVQCDGSKCKRWFHMQCIEMTEEHFKEHTENEDLLWICRLCEIGISAFKMST